MTIRGGPECCDTRVGGYMDKVVQSCIGQEEDLEINPVSNGEPVKGVKNRGYTVRSINIGTFSSFWLYTPPQWI